jgi:pimeloyl-ACP methyl ester carboxylesterase
VKLSRYNALADKADRSDEADDPADDMRIGIAPMDWSRGPTTRQAIRKRAGVLTVHGINTQGHWQDDLSTWLQDAGYLCSRVTYGDILLKSIFPWTMNRILSRVELRYNELRRRGLDVSVIAHSFGSLIVGNLLWRKPSVQFERAVLYGSTLSRTFPWRECIARDQCGEILHEVGGRDVWPWFAPVGFALHPQSGWSGVKGFKNPPSNMTQRVYSGAGHSDLQSEAHFQRTWIPFVARGASALPPH